MNRVNRFSQLSIPDLVLLLLGFQCQGSPALFIRQGLSSVQILRAPSVLNALSMSPGGGGGDMFYGFFAGCFAGL